MKIEDYNKYYIQGSDHYLIPRDVFKELFDEMSNWKKESSELKGVIDEARKEIYEYKKIMEDGIEQGAYYSYIGSLQQRLEKLLQILDKAMENKQYS